MERSPAPITLEVSNRQLTTPEKQSLMPQLVHKMLRYFADKLEPYRTPSEMKSAHPDAIKSGTYHFSNDIHFPEAVTIPDRSHRDSLIAKIGYKINDLSPDNMTERELVVWVARYFSNEAEPISGDRTSNKSKIDFLMQTINESDQKFSHNLESAVFNLLRTISRQEALSPEVAGLRRNLKALARKAKFESCQQFISAKSKKTRSA